MKRLIRKISLGTCITAMMFTSTVAFANDKTPQTRTLVLETNDTVIEPNETVIMPMSIITDRPVIPNGQTGYFKASETNDPFYFLTDTFVNLTIELYTPSTFKIGLVDAFNHSEAYVELLTGADTNLFRKTPNGIADFRIQQDGRYLVYVTNYSADPLAIRDFRITSD